MFGLDSVKLIIFGSMILAIVTLAAADAVLWANLSAKDAKIDSATDRMNDAVSRANDYADSQKEYAASLAEMKAERKTLDTELEKQRFARSQADQAQAKAEAETRDARAAFDARVQEIEDEAKAAPGDVRPLGPIVLKRAAGLWE